MILRHTFFSCPTATPPTVKMASQSPAVAPALAPSSYPVEVESLVSVLDMGVKFSYRVPSFSVISVNMRKVKLQVATDDGSVFIFDGCIRADPSLHNKPLPFSLKLNEFCFVEVSIEIGPCQCHHISTIFFRLANFTNNI